MEIRALKRLTRIRKNAEGRNLPIVCMDWWVHTGETRKPFVKGVCKRLSSISLIEFAIQRYHKFIEVM